MHQRVYQNPDLRPLNRGGQITVSVGEDHAAATAGAALAPAPVLRYDYSQIDAGVRGEVQQAAVTIKRQEQQVRAGILLVGQRLSQVKRLLPHGQFSDWCEQEFDLSQRTAQRMMQVAEVFAGKNDTVSFLSDSVLYQIAAPSTPEPARAQVLAEAQAAGTSPTKARVQEIITAHTLAEVSQIERVVSEVIAKRLPDGPRTLASIAAMRAAANIPSSEFVVAVAAALDERGVEFRGRDLRQAIKNVAARLEERIRANQDPIPPIARATDQPGARIRYVTAEDSLPADAEPGDLLVRRLNPNVVPSSATHTRQMGAALGKCAVCGRPLSDPVHAAAGCGPVCSAKRAANFVPAEPDEDDDAGHTAGHTAAGTVVTVDGDTVHVEPLMAWAVIARDRTEGRLDALRSQLLGLLDALPEYAALTGDAAGAEALRAAAVGPLARLSVLLNGR